MPPADDGERRPHHAEPERGPRVAGRAKRAAQHEEDHQAEDAGEHRAQERQGLGAHARIGVGELQPTRPPILVNLERAHGVEEALDDEALVVDRQLDRDDGRLGEPLRRRFVAPRPATTLLVYSPESLFAAVSG